MEVVTADGEIVRASEQDNPDLFWALCGGGGNFGVVTGFDYRLFPVGPQIVGGRWRGRAAMRQR
jgi:FAD/FMN-containing dehydrogenase